MKKCIDRLTHYNDIMCDNFDDLKMVEILVSIRSDDDNSPEEPIKEK